MITELTLAALAAVSPGGQTSQPASPSVENAPISVKVYWPAGRCDKLVIYTSGDLDSPKILRVVTVVNGCE